MRLARIHPARRARRWRKGCNHGWICSTNYWPPWQRRWRCGRHSG